MCARNAPQPCSGSGSRAPDRSNVTADGEGGRHEARSRAQGADRRSMILAQPGSGHRAAACAGRRTGGGARSTPLVGATPPPGVRDRGPGLSPLRRPAADPRRGDGAPRGAPAPRGARARRRAAAGAARPRRLTCARSRPPPAATVPPGGRPPVCPPGLSVGFRASSPDALGGPASAALSFGRAAGTASPRAGDGARSRDAETCFGLPALSEKSMDSLRMRAASCGAWNPVEDSAATTFT